MKRFWAGTAVTGAGTAWSVTLDSKPLRLPGGGTLTVPLPRLAEAVAAEWAAAPAVFTPDDLPLTRLATTAQDRVRQHRADLIQQLAGFGMNDLLCYRGQPPALAARQEAAWQPWLDWAAARHGIRLTVTSGVMPIAQPPEAGAACTTALAASDEYQLAGLGVVVPALGSLVLGLAIQAGALGAAPACDLAQLDSLWQEQHWGQDEAAASSRRALLADVAAAAQFMVICAA